MKHLFLLLLTLCLLLSSCSSVPEEAPSTSISPTGSAVLIPSETDSDPAVPNITDPDASNTPISGVQTDFSQYTPNDSPVAMYSRLSESPIWDLSPTAHPTRIYPFVGQTIHSPHAYEFHHGYLYGIVDETGCILTDPVYSSVVPLRDDGSNLFLPFWVLCKDHIPTYEEGDPHSYTNSLYALSSMDGSFVTECIYAEITAYGERIFAFYPIDYSDPYSASIFDVYDLEGKLVLHSGDLPYGKDLYNQPWFFEYGEGLYVISMQKPVSSDDDPDSLYTECDYYYMDEEGTLLFGPYSSAGRFSHGLAAVQPDNNGPYVYIDKSGTIRSPEYEYCHTFEGEIAIVEGTDGEDSVYHLIDSDFRTLLSSNEYPSRLFDGSYSVTTARIGDEAFTGTTLCYSSAGKLLWKEEHCEALSASYLLLPSPKGDSIILKNRESGKTITFPQYTSADLLGDPNDPIISIFYAEESENYTYVKKYYTKDLEELCTIENYGWFQYWEVGQPYQEFLPIRGEKETCLYLCGSTPFASYPLTDYDDVQLYPGKVAVFTNDQWTRLYDDGGKLFFSYPCGTMDD